MNEQLLTTIIVDYDPNYKKRNEQWVKKAEELYEVQRILKKYELLKDQLAEELKKLSDNESSVGGHFKYTKIERIGTINYKDIPVLKKIDLEQYRGKPTFAWKLTYEGMN